MVPIRSLAIAHERLHGRSVPEDEMKQAYDVSGGAWRTTFGRAPLRGYLYGAELPPLRHHILELDTPAGARDFGLRCKKRVTKIPVLWDLRGGSMLDESRNTRAMACYVSPPLAAYYDVGLRSRRRP